MKNRFIVIAAGLLVLALAVPHQAAACEKCAPAGFICNADYCDYVITCAGAQVGHTGFNECWTDWFGCYTTGGFCQWASLIPLQGQPSDPSPSVS